jgi:hypothetical protein
MGLIKKLFQKSKPEYILSKKDLRWNRFISAVCSRGLDELNDIQKTAVLSFWYHAEMNSGGHSGYFDCWPKTNPEELYNALVTIGGAEIADNCRQAHLNGIADEYIETDEVFASLESDFLNRLLDYVERHRCEIFSESEEDV